MKFLFYSHLNINPNSGGVERVIAMMHNWLTTRGHEITTIYNIKQNDTEQYPHQLQLPSCNTNDKINEDFIVKLISEEQFNIAINFIAIFTRHIRSFECAIKRTRLPKISVYHNTLDAPLRQRPIINKLLSRNRYRSLIYSLYATYQKLPIFKNARYFSENSVADVVLAKSYIPIFRNLINSRPNDLRAIYNPLVYSESRQLEISPRENIVLFVGRLSSQKNLTSLLEIWSSISKKEGWRLEIIGDGSDKEKLIDKAKDLGIQDTINFRGSTDRPEVFYRKSKIFAMTSTFEGFPMTLLECQQFGCIPIIFNSYPAANEIIKNNINGKLIANGNQQDFAEKLTELMSMDDNEWTIMSNKCKESVLKYNLESIMNGWMDLINKYAIQ